MMVCLALLEPGLACREREKKRLKTTAIDNGIQCSGKVIQVYSASRNLVVPSGKAQQSHSEFVLG